LLTGGAEGRRVERGEERDRAGGEQRRTPRPARGRFGSAHADASLSD
jgi:hypothetical protein